MNVNLPIPNIFNESMGAIVVGAIFLLSIYGCIIAVKEHSVAVKEHTGGLGVISIVGFLVSTLFLVPMIVTYISEGELPNRRLFVTPITQAISTQTNASNHVKNITCPAIGDTTMRNLNQLIGKRYDCTWDAPDGKIQGSILITSGTDDDAPTYDNQTWCGDH